MLVVALPAAAILLLAILLLSFVSIFVYPPDVIFANENVIATHKTLSGDVIELTQIWNRSDFYTTTIKRTDPTGAVFDVVVDGDDRKIWKGHIEPAAADNRVEIELNGRPAYRLDVSTWRLTRASKEGEWERFLRE